MVNSHQMILLKRRSTACLAVLQADVYTFFRQIYKMWVECGLYPELNIEDVKDEVFDMAQPRNPLHISPQDLQVSWWSRLGAPYLLCKHLQGSAVGLDMLQISCRTDTSRISKGMLLEVGSQRSMSGWVQFGVTPLCSFSLICLPVYALPAQPNTGVDHICYNSLSWAMLVHHSQHAEDNDKCKYMYQQMR